MANSNEGHAHPNYMLVFGLLVVFTAIEVGIAQASLPRMAMIAVLLLLALIKAGLVAQYFMHLKYDQKILSVIAYIPLPVTAILLTVISMEWAFQPNWSFLGGN